MGTYDAISFVPPRGVRAACARGVVLHEEGYGGDGLQPETVAWARRMARGEAVSPEKATKMNAWFARHAVSPGEAEARRRDKKSPAWVAWLLWGGDAGRRWARRLVRQMANADKRARSRETALQYGPSIAFSVLPTDAEGGPWTVIAYEAELKGYKLQGGGHARITAADIDEMVANFARYPKAPLVVEHADTREGLPAEWAEPRGHVVALRRGTMERTLPDGSTRTVATLEARLDVSPAVRLTINGDAENSIPPTWPSCSITTALGTDPETGESLGTVLWSVSLTAHPRLADIPRLAASQDPGAPGTPGEIMERTEGTPLREHGHYWGEIKTRGDVVAMLRAIFELPVMASEQEVVAGLASVEGLIGIDEDTSGVDVDDLIGAIRRALKLDALKTATEVIAAAREALRVMPATEGEPPAAAESAITTASKPDAEMSRGHSAANPPKEGKPMSKFIEMAAALKLPAVATEEAAEAAIQSLARDGATVREVLGLKPEVAVAAELATITAERTELGKLRVEVKDLRAEAEKRAEAELSRRVEEVLVAEGAVGDEKRARALAAYARADRAAFDRDYPAPSVQELAQRAQDPQRTETVTAAASTDAAAKAADPAARTSVKELTQKLVAVAAEFGEALTTLEALEMVQRGMTPDSLRVELTKRAG